MSWRRLRWWMPGLLLVFCIVRLPVTLFTGFVPAPWQLGLVEGTIWQGRIGQLGINGMQLLSDVRWQWQPTALLRGELAWRLTARDREQQGHVQLGWSFSGLKAHDLALRLPAAPLFTLDRRLASVQLGGDLHIEAAQLSQQDWNSLQLQLLRTHSLVTPQANPFGDYRLGLSRQGEAWHWQITPLRGALAIQGSGTIDPQRGPQGTLTFTPAEPLAAQFTPLLNLIGGSGPSRTLSLGGQP